MELDFLLLDDPNDPVLAYFYNNTAQPPAHDSLLQPLLDSHYQPTTDGDYSNLDNEVVDPLVSMEPHRNQQIADDEKSASVAAIKAFLMSGQPLIDSRPTIQEQPPVSVPEQERTDVPAHRHPLYNPKQADMVEKRLAVLTRMYEEGRITNSRKKYLYETRHLHAKNRKRTPGGTFERKSGPE